MGFLDKLKNVFFEEEEVEEELEKTTKLAKKVEIPKKKPSVAVTAPAPQVVEHSVAVEEKVEETKVVKEPIIEDPILKEEEEDIANKFAVMFEEDDFVYEQPKEKVQPLTREAVNEKKNLYPDKKEESYTDILKKESNYGYTKTYYESKQMRTFTPSPIISPIYGILDKNYKKEEVVTKREVRISSTHGKIDLDSVRNKAFGDIADELLDAKPAPPKKEKEVTVYDVNKEKPAVKGVTLQDADEYYNDLGLAYNVDYSDKSSERNVKKGQDKLEDNLFDLIESMYDKEE